MKQILFLAIIFILFANKLFAQQRTDAFNVHGTIKNDTLVLSFESQITEMDAKMIRIDVLSDGEQHIGLHSAYKCSNAFCSKSGIYTFNKLGNRVLYKIQQPIDLFYKTKTLHFTITLIDINNNRTIAEYETIYQ